jgi:hypothetical protein
MGESLSLFRKGRVTYVIVLCVIYDATFVLESRNKNDSS